MCGMTWPGAWTAERLGLRLTDAPDTTTPLAELAGLAVRDNPRRAHLVVSRVLGKHIPVEPATVLAAADRLAERVLVLLGDQPALVLGYAETAAALGHAVADELTDADYLHTTRRPAPERRLIGEFTEPHSHATQHLLQPDVPWWFQRDQPLVLVDDELTTGRTVAATIRTVHALHPRGQYIVATLVDLRDEDDRRMLAGVADELGTRIDVVSLAAGRIELPPDVLDRGRRAVAELDRPDPPIPPAAGPLRMIAADWPTSVPEGGRHGFGAGRRPAFAQAIAGVAAGLPRDGRILVLGTEELMYAPLRLAAELDWLGAQVWFSSTTRSPVLPLDDPGYAVRTRLTFPAHDGDGPRYAYNVAPGRDGTRFDHIVLVVDDVADSVDGLVAAVQGHCAEATLLILPTSVPAVA
jgi:adenine/guanine phosphoribosyltransferase-like PRPP-binding protein